MLRRSGELGAMRRVVAHVWDLAAALRGHLRPLMHKRFDGSNAKAGSVFIEGGGHARN
jgi:hypothetical protein